jgi:hypothetical protein
MRAIGAPRQCAQPWINESKARSVMSKRENEANNAFRPSDRPFTEYEEEQKALRKNLERLRSERLAREKAKSNETRNRKSVAEDQRSARTCRPL